MAFDGIMLYCVAAELRDLIIGGRIDKIHQPEKDEIHIEIRSGQQSHILLVSASPNYPRVHFAQIRKNNPASPPLFCMVLRKHLIGGRIL
ncbi:MAG: fibronectin/fibrinogen-binding protein, partial [Clostridiales bacterium]|nr:fibronectin/fibrinogen-binding protein [Clostridiales bacterium]